MTTRNLDKLYPASPRNGIFIVANSTHHTCSSDDCEQNLAFEKCRGRMALKWQSIKDNSSKNMLYSKISRNKTHISGLDLIIQVFMSWHITLQSRSNYLTRWNIRNWTGSIILKVQIIEFHGITGFKPTWHRRMSLYVGNETPRP